MHGASRLLLSLVLGVTSGCGVQELEAIIAKYDTFGTTDTSGGSSTTGAASYGSTTEVGGSSDPGSTGSTADVGTVGMTGDADLSSDASGDSGTTQSPGPVCGDGVKQDDEECDDANQIEADGCLSDCTREWFVFVTSEPSTQGDLSGLVGADYQCRHRATKMFLPNGERYKAWISTSTEQAVDRLYHARGPYKLVNGLRVAANWDALIAGPLENPITVTETSESNPTGVFTGTLPDGTRVPGSTYCDDWTDNDGDNFAWFGDNTATDTAWTFGAEIDCGAGGNLYCFEQP